MSQEPAQQERPFKDSSPSVTSGFVGWLTPEETEKLAQMKTTLEAIPLTWESDQELLRFLRARKFDLDKAVLMFTNFKQWYADNRIDRYPDEFPYKALALAELVPSAYAGFDREGHPLQIERTGKIDVPTILSAVSGAAMLEGFIWGQQTQIRRCAESCERLNLPPYTIERFTQIMDLDGLSSAHMQLAQFLQPITKCGEANFPERLSKTLIINHGWVFSMLWALIKLTLDPATREKIIICGSLEELHKYVDPEQLPRRYGGTQDDIPSLADPDVEALRVKYLNDELYQEHYREHSIDSGKHFTKEYDVELYRQYAYCFRCTEEVKFKATFIPHDATSEADHVPVSVETKIEAQKWPTLGTFQSTNGKVGKLVLSWHNDNWWGSKTIKYAMLDSIPELVPQAATPHETVSSEGTNDPKVTEEIVAPKVDEKQPE